VVPRFAGDGTFARLERWEHLPTADTIIWGIPIDDLVDRVRTRLGNRPVYVSLDIDVLDPAHAPGTGTPEPGGLTSRELLEMLRGLDGLNVVGVDVVEVSPSYDHAELTGIAAAHAIYELLSVLPVPSA